MISPKFGLLLKVSIALIGRVGSPEGGFGFPGAEKELVCRCIVAIAQTSPLLEVI